MIAAVTSGCVKGSQPSASPAPSNGPIDPAHARTLIETNWTNFFDSTVPTAQRLGYLQDAPRLRKAFRASVMATKSAQQRATVHLVTFTDSAHASVWYGLSQRGQVALPNAEGTAVFDNGQWKVSAQTFCGLAALNVRSDIPGCSAG